MYLPLVTVLGLVPFATATALPTRYLVKRDDSSTDQNFTGNLAGYDTSRVGPSNANCQRQSYQISILTNNTDFQNVDSNNQGCPTQTQGKYHSDPMHRRLLLPSTKPSSRLKRTSPRRT